MAGSYDVNSPAGLSKNIGRPGTAGPGKQNQEPSLDNATAGLESGASAKNPNSFLPSQKSQKYIVDYVRNILLNLSEISRFRTTFENIDREYCRTNNLSYENSIAEASAEQGNKTGQMSNLRDAAVPVVGPQVDTAHSYLRSVFLTGYPIFSVVPVPGQEAIAEQFNTVIADSSLRGGWAGEIAKTLYDGLKYNIMALEVDWQRRTSYSFFTDTSEENMGKAKSKQTIWEGNVLKYLPMYNVFWDYRVEPSKVHTKGEFAGYLEVYSRIALKQMIQDLDSPINIREAFASQNMEGAGGQGQYFVPNITSKFQSNPAKGENWGAWFANSIGRSAEGGMTYHDHYVVMTLYCRILPSDFDFAVPAKNTPQIWKFIIVNGQVCILAKRLTNQHNYLPIIFGQPKEDGLSYQTLSTAESVIPIQDMATKLYSVRMAAARRNVSDRIIYDPTKIAPEDINSNSPSAKIPVRPGSYGETLQSAVYPLPFEDRSSQSAVQDMTTIVSFGETITGINRPAQGMHMKGNRTLQEFETIQDNSSGRMEGMSQSLEDTFFYPIKEIIKINVIQYQGPTKLFSKTSQSEVQVDPIALRQAILEYKVADGKLPTSKLASTDFVQVLIQTLSSIPDPNVQAQWDIPGMIAFLAATQNVPGLQQFRRTPGMPGITQPGAVPNVAGNPGINTAPTQTSPAAT